MCGIVAAAAPGEGTSLRAMLNRMTDAIEHRGPDDCGFVNCDSLGIAMRRLSIIDLAGGHQPIANETDDIHVVCNGEIYNFLELRASLESAGHRFRTRSDTEVVVHLYEQYGDACVAKLRGMFGLAILDQRRARLLVARDRMGQKPLFYARVRGRLLIASEIKSLLAADPELAEPDHAVLGQYLQFGFISQPDSAFASIRRLPAGCQAVWERGDFRITPYWTLPTDSDLSQSDTQWKQQIDATLQEAVRIRLAAEVPLGIFLSGGLDSSAMVAYAAEGAREPLKTFTVAFDRPEWDESADAAAIAKHFGTDHHELHLGEAQMRDAFIQTLEHVAHYCDEPFGDASAIPTYHISKLARQQVTVILSGDGGDELFGGYTSYRGALFAERYRRWVPSALAAGALPKLADALARVSPQAGRYRWQRVAKVLRDSARPIREAYRDKISIWNVPQIQRLLTQDAKQATDFLGEQYLPDAHWQMLHESNDLLRHLATIDVGSYLLDDILIKVDRMSMAHSLEVRSPMLDHHVVELAMRVPTRLKADLFEGKKILKRVLKSRLPAKTIRKRKQGFSVPLRSWFRGPLSQTVHDYLLDEQALPTAIFNHAYVADVLEQHRRGTRDHANRIWLLLAYAAWHRQRIGSRQAPAPISLPRTAASPSQELPR